MISRRRVHSALILWVEYGQRGIGAGRRTRLGLLMQFARADRRILPTQRNVSFRRRGVVVGHIYLGAIRKVLDWEPWDS